jgi:hypothetical protein
MGYDALITIPDLEDGLEVCRESLRVVAAVLV